MPAALETVLRRDRTIVAGALTVITLLAWAYVLKLAAGMNMGAMDMSHWRMVSTGFAMVMAPALAPWTALEFLLMAAMWTVMMVGMMTPSAAPMILIHARVARQAAAQGKSLAATGWFAAGYLLAWTGFSIVATAAQWALERTALLSPTMATANGVVGGALLIAAGLYQWTPFKSACLRQCQAPLQFIQRHGGFRAAPSAALALGLRHGAYCVGCCWSLMALLFVGGVMNLLWIAALSIVVLVEKLVPSGQQLARVIGVALVIAGSALMAVALA